MYNKDILVYTTSKCNLECPYCYNKNDPNKNFLRDAGIKKRVRFLIYELLKKKQIERIMLTGGEPMLSNETYNLINILRERVRLTIYTNGTLISYSSIKKLSGVEVKISLHGITDSLKNLKFYSSIIPILESAKVKYGFIYLLNAKNYTHLYSAYRTLRSASKLGGFSMKFQPLIIPINSKDIKARKQLSMYNLKVSDWDFLKKVIEKIILYEAKNPLSNKDPIYPFNSNAKKYFDLLRNFYLYNQKPNKCEIAPMIVIGPDGNMRPCMFLFNKIISDVAEQDTTCNRIQNINDAEIIKMKQAKCFSEQCLGALRPME